MSFTSPFPSSPPQTTVHLATAKPKQQSFLQRQSHLISSLLPFLSPFKTVSCRQILSPDLKTSTLQQAGGGPGATQLAASDLLSFSSAPAALSSGASQPAECPAAGDRPLLSRCTEGSVSRCRRAALQGPHLPDGDATSSRRRWRSFCASSLGDLDES